MAKSYKKKRVTEEETIETDTLSKKEQYDLEKKKKNKNKGNIKNKVSKKKNNTKIKQTNLASRIFAIAMLILMISSVVISILAYVME